MQKGREAVPKACQIVYVINGRPLSMQQSVSFWKQRKNKRGHQYTFVAIGDFLQKIVFAGDDYRSLTPLPHSRIKGY